MPKRMGGVMRTAINIEIIYIDPENNLIGIKGCVPGSKNGVLRISPAKKLYSQFFNVCFRENKLLNNHS